MEPMIQGHMGVGNLIVGHMGTRTYGYLDWWVLGHLGTGNMGNDTYGYQNILILGQIGTGTFGYNTIGDIWVLQNRGHVCKIIYVVE